MKRAMSFEVMMKMELMEIGVMKMIVKKNNGVDRTMLLVAVLVLIPVCVYIFSYISSLLCYIIFSFRVGMILAFPEKVSWSCWNTSSRY